MPEKIVVDNGFYIDKGSKIPYYYQLKKYISENIDSGNWKQGQQVLPEIKICENYGISRTVVRQTFQELVNEGYLIKKKARGTFVAKPKIPENLVQSLAGFFEDMTARGFEVRNDILLKKKAVPPPDIAGKLNLKEGEEVIIIKRVRKLNNEPVVIDRTYIPFNLCPGLLKQDLAVTSLYSYMEEEHKLKMDSGTRYIEATVAGEEEARLLGIKKGAPMLYIESVSFLEDGTPLEYYKAIHRGDRSRMVTRLRRMKDPECSVLQQIDAHIPDLQIKEQLK